MCGIAGKLWLDAARPADLAAVRAITARLAHRGPDDEGYAVDGPLALGHRRLSIIDLSPRGRQPMRYAGRDGDGEDARPAARAAAAAAGGGVAETSTATDARPSTTARDGALLLAANGEIYNHAELRAMLGARGHRFASDCDVEVVLPLYRELYAREGPRFVRHLQGMFAFALWDGAARRLLLARDRCGQKPIVYSLDGARLVFASELAALAAEPSLDRTPDWQALSDYLSFRVVPHPRSAWRGARKLPPGHALVIEDGAARLERTWRLAAGPDAVAGPALPEAAARVRELLEAAVRRRLMSDVPLGALLSGGVDSAAVVAFMARHTAGRVRTFTMGFEDAAYDESADALRTARLFDTEHHHEVVRPDALELLDEVVARYGEPFADASALPTLLVSRMAARHVKVVLTGDGGDESFAGYDRHRALLLADALARPPAAPARALLALAASLAGRLGAGGQRAAGTRLRRFEQVLRLPPRARNHAWRVGTGAELRARLLSPEGAERLGAPSFYGPESDAPLRLNDALVLDLERYLPDDVLVKLDVASMAVGLEARSPFLDTALVEYAASLPGRLKAGCRSGKRVLRAALAGVLPPDVLAGRKRGFGVPLDAWFAGPLAGHAREVLLSPEARRRGLFRTDQVAALIDAHVGREVAAHETLFTLVVLERWFLQEDAA